MEIINKFLAILMLPVSILIILEQMKVFSIEFFIDKLLIGAILMILLQLLSLLFVGQNQEGIKAINIITSVIFIIPAVAYIASLFLVIPFSEHLPMIIGVMMLAEAVYALH